MTWQKIDQWHMRNGEWTITRVGKPELYPKPYSLWHKETSHGHYASFKEAEQTYQELINDH